MWSAPPLEVLDQVAWYPDRAVLGEQVFRLQHFKNDDTWDLGESHFVFFKVQKLVDQYRAFFARRPEFRPRNVLELGIWDGGSTVFWFEVFRPEQARCDRHRSAWRQRAVHAVRAGARSRGPAPDAMVSRSIGPRRSDGSGARRVRRAARARHRRRVALPRADEGVVRRTLSAVEGRRPLPHRGLGMGPLARVPPAQPDVRGRATHAVCRGSSTGGWNIG